MVCNNGRSVSLNKQADASFGRPNGPRSYLDNVDGLSFHKVADSMGIPAAQMAVEVVLPSVPQVWRGIRLTQGFEQLAEATV